MVRAYGIVQRIGTTFGRTTLFTLGRMTVDRFGNLETSFVGDDLDRLGVQVGDQIVLKAGDEAVEALLGESFFDVQMGEWVAFVSQSGRLMVGRSYGSAASTLDLSAGARLSLQAAGSKQ